MSTPPLWRWTMKIVWKKSFVKVTHILMIGLVCDLFLVSFHTKYDETKLLIRHFQRKFDLKWESLVLAEQTNCDNLQRRQHYCTKLEYFISKCLKSILLHSLKWEWKSSRETHSKVTSINGTKRGRPANSLKMKSEKYSSNSAHLRLHRIQVLSIYRAKLSNMQIF